METYPIMLDGELAGKLNVETKGGRTRFDAECKLRPDLVRISVYGGGREGYLGVLAPEGGALTLHKALSRAETRDFPAEIERVERAGQGAEASAAAQPEAGTPEAEGTGTAHAAPTEPAPEEEHHSWYASPDGALIGSGGADALVALPVGDRRVPADIPGERREIAGREYFVYRTKDGKIVR